MEVCAVIPAHNEAATIVRVIQETKKYIDTIFVVDNGSTDNPVAMARQSGAEAIDYSAKLRKGSKTRRLQRCYCLFR